MRKALVISVAMVSLMGAATAQAALVDIAMDTQITHPTKTTSQSPNGDAIYVPAFSGANTQTIFAPGAMEPEGFTRHNMLNVPGTWYYQYLDLNLAGIGEVNLSAPDATLEFDVRYYQDPNTNTNQYGDAPVFARIYTYEDDGDTYAGHRDFGIIYGPNDTVFPFGDWYPTWQHVTININSDSFADGGAFDVTQVSRIRWYGTDWAGGGDDFVDIKNVVLTPEPTSLALLAVGGLLCLRRRRV